MKRILITVGLFLSVSAIALNAQQVGTKSNTGRQVSQQTRIAEGGKDGELTRKETARLEREQRRIEIEKRMAKADGTVTPGEKRFLRHEQNRASRHIARQKHDPQKR